MPRRVTSVLDKYAKYITIPVVGECWGWGGPHSLNGYGQLFDGKQNIYAHRLSYQLFFGGLPAGMCVLHKCDNRECTNPNHLFLGTHQDNSNDKLAKHREARGERCGSAKLSNIDVYAIRALLNIKVRQKEIAKRFGVNQSTVSKISSGKLWRFEDAASVLSSS